MAKSKYETHVLPKLDEIEEWAKSGLIDIQICNNLGIGKDSFYKYKNEHIEFSDALKRGKEVIDLEVENALLKRALGYRYEEITKEPVKNNPTQLQTTKQVTKEVLPDVTAQIFWLKNRRPEDWRDKKEIFSSGSNMIQISLED